MAKKKNTDGISLSEFRAWLQGVEEMQGPDWAPSVEQWRRIKSKFNDIVEEETIVQAAPVVQQQRAYTQPFQQLAPGTMLAPERPSMPQPLPSGLLTSPGDRAKTLDIDSSNGYQSSLV